ncbi:LIC12611 family phage tail protein [Leptospira adleri]|uniref:Uncharacterized protein n=1 Tax=Leptospira adleri TaxID=2023186 RepID=A0A2M9YNR7_9LEPT|nr:hypothetical protein [Leptospira adleri]PJZ53178.1 hypothetical protein CH380_12055 [Leptospira adleri]PJZ62126.1 hypothetical protein CH376_09790 [Leptospira adleri]
MAARELNVTIKIGVDPDDPFSGIRKELDDLRSKLKEFSDSANLVSESGIRAWESLGASMADSVRGMSGLALLSERLGTTEGSLRKLYASAKGNPQLEKEFFNVAKAAGFTEKDVAKLNFQLSASSKIAAAASASFRILSSIASSAFRTVIGPSLEAGIALEKQNEVLKTLSGTEYPKLQSSIENAVRGSKGLSNQRELTEAANQAVKAGLSVDFISKNLSGLQKSSRLAGNDLSSSMQDAYTAINEGNGEFLKKNGVLFSDYTQEFERINQSGISAADKRLAREKLLSSALSENSKLQNSYGEHVRTTSALVDRFNGTIEILKEKLGSLILDALNPVLRLFVDLFEYFTIGEEAVGRLEVAGIVLGSILAGIVAALIAAGVQMLITSGFTFASLIPALIGMAAAGWAAIAPWLPFIAIGIAVALVIGGITFVIRDLFKWMKGGKSVIGDFLQFIDPLIQKFNTLLDTVRSFKDKIIQFFSDLGSKIRKMISDIVPAGVLKFLGIAPEVKEPPTQVQDAIITKHGKVIQFHPDDNLVAVKDLGILGGSKSGNGKGISVNIANVTLGSGSTQKDAQMFGAYLEKELEKIALKIGLQSGLSPEGAA